MPVACRLALRYIILNAPTNSGVICMTVLWILLAIAAVLGIYVWRTYNTMVRSRNLVDEGWSGIDVQLKRRADLVLNLVETVKGYAKHEKELFEKVTQARAAAVSAGSVGERAQAENALTGTIRSFSPLPRTTPSSRRTPTSLTCSRTSGTWRQRSRWPAGTTTGLSGPTTP